jgi:hypothetical protein
MPQSADQRLEKASCSLRAIMILSEKSATFQDHPLRLKQRAELANVRHAFKSKYFLNELGACLGT